MKKGRPNEDLFLKYHIEEKMKEIEILCRSGAIDKDLAKFLKVSLTTFYKIKRQSKELSEIVRNSKVVADLQIENALYKIAVGFDYEETTQEVKTNEDGSASPVLIRKTKKHIPGNVTAQIFWLKNRRPEKWRDKHVVENEYNPFMEALMNLGKRSHDK
jgi:hypothetical protein